LLEEKLEDNPLTREFESWLSEQSVLERDFPDSESIEDALKNLIADSEAWSLHLEWKTYIDSLLYYAGKFMIEKYL